MSQPRKHSLFEGIPAELPEEFFEDLLSGRDFRVERIISRGHASAEDFWYEQEEHEWVLLVRGSAELHFEEGDRRVSLQAGDHINIPAHCRHRVANTAGDADTSWLAIFYRD